MPLGKLRLRLPLADVLADQQRNGLRIESVGVADVFGLADLPPIHPRPV